MNFVKILLLCSLALVAVPVEAQTTPTATDMQILLDKVKADKKLVIAANMDLTEPQAKAFWPIYEACQTELKALNERLGVAILAYADAYNNNTLTDAQANSLTAEALGIDRDEVALRTKYAARLNKVLPGKKVARYLQIENKIRAAIRFDMAAGIPLVQ